MIAEKQFNVLQIFAGSDGEATKALYARLTAMGSIGIVAMNLFRAQKASSRAKIYRGGARGIGSYKSMAYEKKNWSIGELCQALEKCRVEAEGVIGFGWKEDAAQEYHNQVLYVDLPTGQVSFHAATRGIGPDYSADWDKTHLSAERICRWVQGLVSVAIGDAIEMLTSEIKTQSVGLPVVMLEAIINNHRNSIKG